MGYSQEFGVRELKRAVRKMVEDKVAQALLSGRLKAGDMFSLE
jgi:ATP-dependent Clp protease ATP-binding subunit ClpA